MKRPSLSLTPDPDPDSSGENADEPGPAQILGVEKKPVLGWLAIGFGVLGIFTNGTIFVPLAFICSVAALFVGQGAWAFGGFLLSVAGLLTSPVLLALLGLGALAAYFGLPM
jgi:hypothetical protein